MSQQLKSLQFTFSLKFILVLCTIMYNIRYVHDHIHSVRFTETCRYTFKRPTSLEITGGWLEKGLAVWCCPLDSKFLSSFEFAVKSSLVELLLLPLEMGEDDAPAPIPLLEVIWTGSLSDSQWTKTEIEAQFLWRIKKFLKLTNSPKNKNLLWCDSSTETEVFEETEDKSPSSP